MKNNLILFSKCLKDKSLEDMARTGRKLGIDGFDLCVRAEHPVTPQNVGTTLPKAARLFRDNGLSVPMVTGEGSLLMPDDTDTLPIMDAMREAGVRLLKLGYFGFDPAKCNYWAEVDRIRRALEGWAELGRRYGIKICYHTHSHKRMGMSAGMLMHLLKGVDSEYIRAYLDPFHLLIDGEDFEVAAAITDGYVEAVALKDVIITRAESCGHGTRERKVVPAGQGMVDWTSVFKALARIKFSGPFSIHCEFKAAPDAILTMIKNEVAFFREKTAACNQL